MQGKDKVFLPLLGRPLISYVLTAFESCPEVDIVVLVLSERNLHRGERLVREGPWRKVAALCSGGLWRQDSVVAGLAALGPVEWVVVHDGARPCVTPELISQGLKNAQETGAAVAGVPTKDTIKVVDGHGSVRETLDRSRLWAVQTPQVFRRELLSQAHSQVPDEVTDDATLVERLGVAVKVYLGSYGNVKVTTEEDVPIAESFLRAQGSSVSGEGGA